MNVNARGSYIELPTEVEELLVAGARDERPVRGLTHSYYKYPARFSPSFVRAAIQAFTCPGDVCLDPHVGGGTTLPVSASCAFASNIPEAIAILQ